MLNFGIKADSTVNIMWELFHPKIYVVSLLGGLTGRGWGFIRHTDNSAVLNYRYTLRQSVDKSGEEQSKVGGVMGAGCRVQIACRG